MNKIFLLLIVLLLIPVVHGVGWHEQRRIAEDTGRELGYDGSFRFVYYTDYDPYAAYYNHWEDERGFHDIITFFRVSSNFDSESFKCVVLHELGHYFEVKNVCGDDCPRVLNEDYANNYMSEIDLSCVVDGVAAN